MTKSRHNLYRVLYCVAAVIGIALLMELLRHGSQAYPRVLDLVPSGGAAGFHFSVVSHLLIAIGLIIVSSKLLGLVFQKLKQPPIMGEVIAGIALGPSLFGQVWPQAASFVFPPELQPILNMLAQLGVILFMFVVGLEFDSRLLKKKGEASMLISHASIFVPFTLGCIAAYYLFPRYAPAQSTFLVFALFIGVSLSVTAFPVLARILADLKISKTPLATLTLTCAAVDDVTAWFLLAAISSIAHAQVQEIGWTLALTLGYLLCVFFVLRPVIRRVSAHVGSKPLSAEMFALCMLLLLLSAFSSEAIGIHALFGAFILGVLIPSEGHLAKSLQTRIEPLTRTLLLPIFFAYTGLRTQLQLLNSSEVWLLALGIIILASLGKIGGTSLAARLSGLRWRDSLALGALMNTRGLVELVVLNVGLDLGIISPLIFSVFVVMAITTTLMTGPLFQWITLSQPWNKHLRVHAPAGGSQAS